MAANEIAERFAAACWVRLGSDGGEAINTLANDQIGYRSRIGFTNRIITTLIPQTVPLIVLPLDRVLSRRETAVFANRIATVEPFAGERYGYPFVQLALPDTPQVMVQPIMLAWLGADLSNPDWMPFGLLPGPNTVPGDSDLNLYDAIALLLPYNSGALSGDVCVGIFEHPQPDAEDEPLEEVLPAEEPPFDPLTLDPLFWWRMDDTNDSGGDVISFRPRSQTQTEGSLALADAVPAPLAPDALFNGRPTISDAGNQMTPTGFSSGVFDPLGGATWSVYIVCAPRNDLNQQLMVSFSVPPHQYEVFSDPANDELTVAFEEYAATPMVLPWAASVNVKQLLVLKVDEADVNQLTATATSAGSDTESMGGLPPGTADHPLFNTIQTLVGGGIISYAEIIGFPRVLSAPEETELLAYFTDLYGAF